MEWNRQRTRAVFVSCVLVVSLLVVLLLVLPAANKDVQVPRGRIVSLPLPVPSTQARAMLEGWTKLPVGQPPPALRMLISELEGERSSDKSKWLQLGYVKLKFDSTCDGRAQVQSGWGSYGPIQGQRVPLQFQE